uniref:BHLH domain-containing protein n=1 Tax=Monopterus albus TaxID=43700 RepID=A0A3Q3JXF0_MONAL|nr:protein L-Myc-1b-like [Monopterus albus]XP_020441961.1 protein L-Myc-1b-like [Monopterus albus]XP_020441962.1 protein L-Myc-1b-like [Monopterus albus]XP_020441963.1 protein L-Myc-1b-like [Monopterus albus]XP_020441965.1 protein L-Myc-1b-like [Monopterus albus]
MPSLSSTAPRYENWDMDHLDHYQHYFYDDRDPDEDFFKSTAPSEDIWKKFELVLTPPMSPIRAVEGSGRVGLLYPSLGDKLEWVSQFLGQEDEQQQDLPCKLTTTSDSIGNLSSIIIQDCMWSGLSAGQQLERVVGERFASYPAKVAASSALASLGRAQCAPADAPAPGGLSADCVDPAAVLTFPLIGGCKKQVSSGSESHTDSSDDDDKDEDEEEIDVVTVEHKQQCKPRRLVSTRKPVTITVRADPLDPGTKRFHISIHQQQHNYAAPSPDILPPPAEPPRKRVRQEASVQPTQPPQNPHCQQPRPGHAPLNLESRKSHVTVAGVRSELPNLSATSPTSSALPSSPPYSSSSHPHSSPLKAHSHLSSPQSSDCEDTDKRKAHNFLERKRRNDLRYRFLSLRDEIPGLADCPKTPKVAILTRATEYLQQLHANERQKAQERKQLKARQLQLLQRLAQLKRSRASGLAVATHGHSHS